MSNSLIPYLHILCNCEDCLAEFDMIAYEVEYYIGLSFKETNKTSNL